MLPSVSALGVGLHVALDQHGHHHAEHTLEISELAQAATHGHHHDAEAAPEHDHDAKVEGSALTLRLSASLGAVLPAVASLRIEFAETLLFEGSPRRGPPVPLFTTHCSLLL